MSAGNLGLVGSSSPARQARSTMLESYDRGPPLVSVRGSEMTPLWLTTGCRSARRNAEEVMFGSAVPSVRFIVSKKKGISLPAQLQSTT